MKMKSLAKFSKSDTMANIDIADSMKVLVISMTWIICPMVVHSPNVLTADWTEINNIVKSDAKSLIIFRIIAENHYLIN